MSWKPAIEYRCCPICNKYFGITSQQKRKVYCNDCRDKHYRDLRLAYRADNKEKEKKWRREYYKKHKIYATYTCALCDKEFQTGKRGKTKYCMDCLHEHRYEAPYTEYYRNRGGDI